MNRSILRRKISFKKSTLFAITGCLATLCSLSAFSLTYTVSDTSDAGAGTLREAITLANNHLGKDTIVFQFAQPRVHTILVDSLLPELSDPNGLLIDGYAHSGSPNSQTYNLGLNNTIHVALTASSNVLKGLVIRHGQHLIRGLAVFGFDSTQIDIYSNANVISGCFIGMYADGQTASKHGHFGIRLRGDSNFVGDGTLSGANLVSGLEASNGIETGVRVNGSYNQILGNFIGTQKDGISVTDASTQRLGIVISGKNAHHNTVGGNSSSKRNTISGQKATGTGLAIENGAHHNVVIGNYIGPSSDGQSTTNGGVQSMGISISLTEGGGNRIGGSGAGEGNVISGNNQYGIRTDCWGDNTIADTLIGNVIGLQGDGFSTVANSTQLVGIFIVRSVANIIGTGAPADANIISGNPLSGILILQVYLNSVSTGNQIRGNYIGPGRKDGLPFEVSAATQKAGIEIDKSAVQNEIGGPDTTYGNVIAYNTEAGIRITRPSSFENKITHNLIYFSADTAVPIVLSNGANRDYPTPQIDTASAYAIIGTSQPFDTIEVFKSDIADPHCQQITSFVSIAIADESGRWTLACADISAGDVVKATARDSLGNTSPFSNCATVIASDAAIARNICSGDSIVLTTCFPASSQFRWSNGQTLSDSTAASPTAFPEMTTTYFLRVDGILRDSITVVVFPSLSIQLADTIFKPCVLDTFLIANASSGAGGPYHYQWTGGPDSNIYDGIHYAGTYHISVNDQASCRAIDSVVVITPTIYPVSLGHDTTVCAGDSIYLQPDIGHIESPSHTWSGYFPQHFGWKFLASYTHDTAIYYEVEEPVSIAVSVQDGETGCQSRDTIQISLHDPNAFFSTKSLNDLHFDTNSFSASIDTFQIGDSIKIIMPPLYGEATVRANEITYQANENLDGKDSLTYLVCHYACLQVCDTGKIIVDLSNDTSAAVDTSGLNITTISAKGFSPNGDGVNDAFFLEELAEDVSTAHIYVFNAWGNIVYEKQPYLNDWQGDANRGFLWSNHLEDGTYYYLIKTEAGNAWKGFVILSR